MGARRTRPALWGDHDFSDLFIRLKFHLLASPGFNAKLISPNLWFG
jgi:hypothetical protein